MGAHTFGLKSADRRVGSLGRATGSLVLVMASMVLPVGTASAAPIPQTHAVLAQAAPVAPTESQQQERRLANGQFVRAGSRTGAGQLRIDNGAGHDAVLTLTINRNAAYSVYMRKGMQFTMTGIRDGTYEAFFTAGTDWDSQARAFTRERTFHRLDASLPFRTTNTQRTGGSITLYEVPGGNTNISAVDPGNYPAP